MWLRKPKASSRKSFFRGADRMAAGRGFPSGGKSGHHRAGMRVTPAGGNPRGRPQKTDRLSASVWAKAEGSPGFGQG